MKTSYPWKIFFHKFRVNFVVIIAICFLIVTLKMDELSDYLILLISYLVFSCIETYFNLKPLHKIKNQSESISGSLPAKFQPIQVINEDDWHKISKILQNTDQFVAKIDKLIYEQNITSENLLESIFDAIIIIDPFLNSISYNQTFINLFEPNFKSDSQDKVKIWKFIQDDKILSYFRLAVEHPEPIKISQYFLKNKTFDIVISPLVDADNKIIGALGIFHDITKSIQIDKMRVDFVANVSHEIRTPLTSIKGYAQLLGEHQEQLPLELKPFINKIVTNTDKMISLFNDLLDLSVIESKDSIQKDQIYLNEMFQSIKEKLRGKYLHKNWKAELRLEQNSIIGNPRMLEQAFTNLLDNAIKYSNENPCLIEIQSQINQSYVEILISDNGPGIEESHLKRIFERFYRISSEFNKGVEGKGLGLSIVKHIILKHNGEILALKREPQGTTFKIILPIS